MPPLPDDISDAVFDNRPTDVQRTRDELIRFIESEIMYKGQYRNYRKKATRLFENWLNALNAAGHI